MAIDGGPWASRVGPALAVALAAALLAGCGTAADRDQARAAAERLYAAVRDHDGAAACAALTPDARKELESQEQKSCDEAILDLDLQGTRAGDVEVYVNEAAVQLVDGDTVFLDETPEGWRVSAAGCQGREPAHPADCEVQA